MQTNEIIYFVTSNEEKFNEALLISKRYNVNLEVLKLGLNETQSLNQKIVSNEAAVAAFAKIRRPLIIDDSGLYIEGYKDFPGAFTKFIIQQIGIAGLKKLVPNNTNATWKCFATYVDKNRLISCIGDMDGKILFTGNDENCYDDIFFPNKISEDRLSEITLPRRALISHRSSALSQIFTRLRD